MIDLVITTLVYVVPGLLLAALVLMDEPATPSQWEQPWDGMGRED